MLWLEDEKRTYLADRTAFLTVMLDRGAKDATPPTWEDRKAAFDAELAAEPRQMSARESVLHDLGLAG